jgi:hypothetical protein
VPPSRFFVSLTSTTAGSSATSTQLAESEERLDLCQGAPTSTHWPLPAERLDVRQPISTQLPFWTDRLALRHV